MKPLNAVWFSHGKESGPWGTKIRYMARLAQSRGCFVESVDYRGVDDPDDRVRMLIDRRPEAVDHLVLVGSSMGGYVACAASEAIRPQGLFLMAPAVRMTGFGRRDVTAAGKVKAAVHGWNDEVVPVGNAIRFSRENAIDLHLLHCGHTLRSRLPAVLTLFEAFLDEVLRPPPAR